jgi:hypothetical protein
MDKKKMLLPTLLICAIVIGFIQASHSDEKGGWIDQSQSQWPQITMINQIDYIDKHHPVAGCAFLLDTGKDTLAVTAKHVLIYFKSEKMNSVSFNNTLKSWRMFPKNSPNDVVVIDRLINEDREEPIDKVPVASDWLLFTVKEKSRNIKPLRFRTEPLTTGEKVFVIGWRYTDKNCPQIIYEGSFVKSEDGSVLISCEKLADNTVPGLSGSPVVDSKGRLIGVMSQKAGEMQRLSSIAYPTDVLNKLGMAAP